MSDTAALLVGSTTLLALAAALGRSRGTTATVYRLTFPRTIDAGQLTAAFRALTGLLPPWWRRLLGRPTVTLEVHGSASGIEHVVVVTAGSSGQVVGTLRAALPGLRFEELAERPMMSPTLCRELAPRGSGSLRVAAANNTTSGVLAALQPLHAGEHVLVQYVIAPIGRSLPDLFSGLLGFGDDGNRAPRAVAPAEPDLAVGLRVGVVSRTPERTAQLATRLLGSFHALGTPDAHLRRRLLPSRVVAWRMADLSRAGRGSVLRADELAAVAAVPLDAPQLPGLVLSGSRVLAPNARIPRTGLVLGDALAVDGVRPVAIALPEVRRGLHLCAPTGAGKSTVLVRIGAQLMAAGQALVAIESKGDLVAELARQIPPGRASDVIVFDPADRARPVGFNLIGGTEDADLVIDHVVGQFRARYGAAGLGPRSEDILRAALLTLTTEPGRYTLCEVEPLLMNAAFRQRLVAKLDEPVLESFWAWFSSMSEAARAEAVAPLANKLRTYTLRARLRAVIGQADGLDLAAVLAERKILLVSLAKGLVGEDAAALLGAAMVSRLWAAIMARAGLPEAQRPPATIVCDEFQDFAALPLAFGDAVAQSRGYGVAWVLAHQNLAQLDAKTRAAVLANCRSRLVMQTTADDAAAFAREFAPHLDAADLKGLGPFEGYAAISAGAAVAPPVTIRTRPAPQPQTDGNRIRERSRTLYGASPADVDGAIRARVLGSRPAAPVGGRRRTS